MTKTDKRCDPWCYALQTYCNIGNDPSTCKYAIYERTEEGVLKLKKTDFSEAIEIYERNKLEAKIEDSN